MGRVYKAVVQTKQGLKRVGKPWDVTFPAGVEHWGAEFEKRGLQCSRPPLPGRPPMLPYQIAGKHYEAAKAAFPELPVFRVRNAVAAVSDSIDLRGATVEELEAGIARSP